MIYTSEAIVLKTIKYSENSIIVHLFTLKNGHQVVLTSRNSGKRKQTKAPFIPLSIIEVEAYLSPKKNIQRLKAYSHTNPLHSIPFHPIKTTIALFLSEIYWSCSNGEGENKQLYDFFKTSIQFFDIMEQGIANFHLKNLLDLSRLLGFAPENSFTLASPYFNLVSGKFQAAESNETTNVQIGKLIGVLLNTELSQLATIDIKGKERGVLIDNLMTYFKVHLAGFKIPKSIQVFREMI